MNKSDKQYSDETNKVGTDNSERNSGGSLHGDYQEVKVSEKGDHIDNGTAASERRSEGAV
ncbi:hypothetical protein AKO1_013782 [Acrasis kona]|uniref:Dehydrin 2 n=1 Tax=Acrasis kona TaxID=1008807 RepID=A0AAW2ZKJ5_9EUKA